MDGHADGLTDIIERQSVGRGDAAQMTSVPCSNELTEWHVRVFATAYERIIQGSDVDSESVWNADFFAIGVERDKVSDIG
jgi:hypothetical protein